ncbi:hypothetical protein [Burkholderia ubonensis]|uniref:hypothetical protein n=2 Tax=Burkholderia ubonensis TaxID=101571 RepID=UPI00076C0997|nr:hypothetical protein [Burkholderia ubonensis]KUZ38682.1 hypothetical protein WI30_04255 [Burkholderia ubonensis]
MREIEYMNQSSSGTKAFQSELDAQRTGVKTAKTGRETIKLAGGKTHTMPVQPHDDPRHALHVAEAIAALNDIHADAQQVAGDARLSDLGRREKLAASSARHIKAIADAAAGLNALDAEADAREAAHWTPAPLKAGDVSGAVVDGQVRSQFHAMTKDEKDAVLAKVRDGGLPVVIDALQRDPFQPSEAVTNAFRAHMAVRAPVERAQIDVQRANGRWAQVEVRRIAKAAMGATGMGSNEIRAAIGKNHEGGDAFGLSRGFVPSSKPIDTSDLSRQSSNAGAVDMAGRLA